MDHTHKARTKYYFLVLKFFFPPPISPYCRRSTEAAANAVQVMRARMTFDAPSPDLLRLFVRLFPYHAIPFCCVSFSLIFKFSKNKTETHFFLFAFCFCLCCFLFACAVRVLVHPSHRQHPPSSPTLFIPSLCSPIFTQLNISFHHTALISWLRRRQWTDNNKSSYRSLVE